MAPKGKRHRCASSSVAKPPPKYEKDRFISFAAQKKYIESFVKRGVIHERGLYVTMESVSKQVKKRK